jgi:membrane-bound ClpP family serine protease
MGIIITLIIVGALLLIVELTLLPGLSVAGIAALIAYGIAIYLGFDRYDTSGGVITIGVVLAVSVAAIALALRAKTWQKFALNKNIDSTSQPLPDTKIKVGDHGKAITRLAPMGKVEINGETYEAKSLGDSYIDPGTEIEVAGFENFSVIVKKINT